jgi:ATP-dependent exoDNAse (exonuclease V) beta subunit
MIEFTAAQRNAIGLDALDRDTCVVAGPGSGKTTVLIERFRGLVESGVAPQRILAITFTEKATSQMRERLARAFADQPDLILQIQRAYVSTVHGFCVRLLRENAILAGVDPRFRVLNEQEAFALERRSVDDALDALLAEWGGPVRDLLSALRSPDLGDSILEIYHAMRAAGISLANLAASGPKTGGRLALNALALECGRIDLPEAAQLGARLRERRGQPIARLDFQILSDFYPNLSRIQKKDREPIKRVREETIPQIIPLLAAEYYAAHRQTLLAAAGHFDALYRNRKDDRSALDFSDLEVFSVRLLEKNPEARERIRRQFDHILMDEFQDTNGLQSKLLDLLRSENRFYAVGDINQSIYGFRHADPQVFDTYRRLVESEGKHLAELRENWRSRADILRAVSSLVGAGEGIERHSFQPVRKFRRKAVPSVEVICCLAEESEQALALEASWVASRIGELQGSLRLEAGVARFGDMAVLVRKADSIQAFTDAFDAAGIPYVVTAGKGFFEAREVNDLTHLLRVLANPRDEISLTAVLRSPLAGVTDATLYELKQQGNLGEALASSADPAVSAFAVELARWREVRRNVSPDRLLIRAMDRSGYELQLGPRERANIEKFLVLVRESGARQSLDELIEELQRLRESDPREQDSAAEESGDVVRVLTIHAAKGLEFPVVFLPALQAGMNQNLPPALLSPRLGLGVRWRNPVTGHSAKDSLYEAIEADLRAREAAESNRLLYVAMTRAEEHLVLSCSGSGKLANWAGYLAPSWNLALDTPSGSPREHWITAPDGATFAVRVLCTDRPPAPAQQLSLEFAAEAPTQVAAPAISGQYDSAASVTSVALFADCPRRYYLARYVGWEGGRPRPIAGEEEAEEEEQSDRDQVDSTEFGRQVHALLAGSPRDGASAEALALAARFESSDLGRRVNRATEVEREFDFLVALEDVVLRGQIDLWFEDSGEQILVDYKTDDLAAEEAPARAEAYAPQLQLYAIAAEGLTGRPPDRALLYFLRPEVTVPVDVSRPALDQARRKVRQFQQSQQDQRFPLVEASHCLRCPFFRGMCPATIPVPSE